MRRRWRAPSRGPWRRQNPPRLSRSFHVLFELVLAPRPGLEPGTYGLTVADKRIFWDFMGLLETSENHYISMGYAILLFQLISLDSIRAQDFSDTSRTRRPTDACDNGPSHRSPQAESAAFHTDGRSWPA